MLLIANERIDKFGFLDQLQHVIGWSCHNLANVGDICGRTVAMGSHILTPEMVLYAPWFVKYRVMDMELQDTRMCRKLQPKSPFIKVIRFFVIRAGGEK